MVVGEVPADRPEVVEFPFLIPFLSNTLSPTDRAFCQLSAASRLSQLGFMAIPGYTVAKTSDKGPGRDHPRSMISADDALQYNL